MDSSIAFAALLAARIGIFRDAARERAYGANQGHVLAVTGVRREAAIARAVGVVAISHGGHQAHLRRGLSDKICPSTRGLISFGVAGGLDPELPRGATILADEVVGADGRRWQADPAWRDALRKLLPDAISGAVAAADGPVTTPVAKAALRASTSAAVVDNESEATAEFAARHGLPFVVLRVVLDDCATSLPDAALVALTSTGGTSLARILASLLANPRQMPDLIGCGRDAAHAFGVLARQRRLLGTAFGRRDCMDDRADSVETSYDSMPDFSNQVSASLSASP